MSNTKNCFAGSFCIQQNCKFNHPTPSTPSGGYQPSMSYVPHYQPTPQSYDYNYGGQGYYSQGYEQQREPEIFPEYQNCNCCKGYIYECADWSESCAMIGVCGCAYEETQNFDPQQDDLDEEDINDAMQDMVLVEQYLARREEWFPDAANCSCCNGLKYGCKYPICKSLSECRCSIPMESKEAVFSVEAAIEYSQQYNGFPKNQDEIDMIQNDKQRMKANQIRVEVQKLVVFLEIGEERRTVSPSASLLLVLAEKHKDDMSVVCKFFRDCLLGTIVSGKREEVFYSCLYRSIFQNLRDEDEKEANAVVSVVFYLLQDKLFAKLQKHFHARQASFAKRSSPPESKPIDIDIITGFNSFMQALESEFPTFQPKCFDVAA